MAENKIQTRVDTIYKNGVLTAEFVWATPLQLAAYKDHTSLLEYSFRYDASGILSKVRITAFTPEKSRSVADTDWLANMVAEERRQRLHDFLGTRSLPFELFCGCDQVGTLKILTDKSGRLVKEVVRDSFGVQQGDSFPDLFMPIGFAGGLTDPDTGLVRFGYRDYDPGVGRFTAPDPLGDTGGDHDVYDYCIDDPVNNKDPNGLFFWPIVRPVLRDAIFPEPLNEAEVRMSISQEKSKIDAKIRNKTATTDDMERYEKIRKEDARLKEKFNDEYRRDSDFWNRYPTF